MDTDVKTDTYTDKNTDINITIVENREVIDTPVEKIPVDAENTESCSTEIDSPVVDIAVTENINIDIELSDCESTITDELNNSFSAIKSNYNIKQLHKHSKRVIPKQLEIETERELEPRPYPVKMRSCGTWFDECFDCCCMPIQCMPSSCRFCSDCCSEIIPRMRPVYFFILYLFTGELNKEAIGYKNYFNIKSVKDDQVNVPEIFVTAISIVFELYKTMIGSFLTVFTAQRCGQQTCTIWENIVPKNDLELAGIVCNFLMATTLLIEYIFEIMREVYLIKYLKYDKCLANNGEHIAELYENTDKHIFEKLIPLYIIYIRFSYVVLLVYFVNVILSGVIVSANYYDNTSIFSFVTNALFIIYKIYNVVEITSYRGNYFYSAYKKKNIHYNNVKPKYLIQSGYEQTEKQTQSFSDIEQPFVDISEHGYNEILVPDKNVQIKDVIELSTINKPLTKKFSNTNDHYALFIVENGEHLDECEKEDISKYLYR